jgi:hypothetical protein
MILNFYAAVVSHNEDISLLHLAGRQIPIAPINYIRFFALLAVYIKLSIAEFDFLPFQGHNSLQEHDPGPGESDGNHVGSVWIGKEVSAFPAEMKIPVSIGRFHAGPLNPERKTHIAEKEIRGTGNKPDPDEKSGRKLREEKTADGPAGGDHFWGSSSRTFIPLLSTKTDSGLNPFAAHSPRPKSFLMLPKMRIS